LSQMNTLRQTFLRVRNLRGVHGQISIDEPLGRWISAVVSDPDVRVVLEIGSWEGKGSTRVLGEVGSELKDPPTVISLEANRDRAARAARRNSKFRHLKVICGTLVQVADLDVEDLSDVERDWLLDDLRVLTDSPYILDMIPSSIDALILDGGEFSTRAEFELLQRRLTKYLVLDDTRTRKCRKIAEEIRNGSSQFSVIVDSADRNGFMIAKKMTSQTAVAR